MLNLQSVKCLRFDEFGEPSKVLYLDLIDIGEWDGTSALVRWLASPVDPVDLFVIKGQYGGYTPKLPAVGGIEGVGVVEKIGQSSKNIQVGDRVIRFKMPNNQCPAGGGIWSEFSFMPAEALLKVDQSIDLAAAAMLGINPPTAYAMLTEIVPLKQGDCIIQNAANSSVGRAVIQLAKHFGYQTINLIREQSEDVAETLRSLGATWIFTEEKFADIIKGPTKLPTPKLGLNCVGGNSALLVSQALGQEGILVTYGEISECPSRLAPNLKEQKCFSIGQFCSEKKNCDKVAAMFKHLQQLILDGQLRPSPAQFHQMDDFQAAVENAISHGTKQILLLSAKERGGADYIRTP